MDRQIVYPAQIPLDSDLLNAQRNAFVGLGHLAGMAYGDDTVAAGGFACTPGTGLAVTIAPGSLLAAGVVDATAYGTLAANGSVLVRQHISRDPVTLSVPGARATYTVYATPATVDADDTVLPFYNAADPSVTYAGADNSGKTAPTVRQDVAKLGIATAVPDGAYPLWTITVPAAARAITADMIAQAENAPFYETIPELQADLAGRLKLNDAKPQSVTGPVTFEGETEVPDAALPQNPVALGQLQNMAFITNAVVAVTVITSSVTFTRNQNTKWLRIRAAAGGGAGGGTPWTDSSHQASGGGGLSGEYIEFWISAADFGDSVSVVIGAGGLGVQNATGGAGGNTSIGDLVTLAGGTGGFDGAWGSDLGISSQDASKTIPTVIKGIVVVAQPSIPGPCPMIVLNQWESKGGDGGSNPIGIGAQGSSSSGAGGVGYGFGAGGAGARCAVSTSIGKDGGNGTAGGVIIEEYM